MTIGIILGFVFAGIIAGSVYLFVRGGQKKIRGKKLAALLTGAASLVLFIFIPFSFRTVQAGEIAVVKLWGEAVEVKTAGTYFDLWISRQYVRYDATVQQLDIETSAYSSDGQTMEIQMIVQVQVQQAEGVKIADNFGSIDMLLSRIKAISIENLKAELSTKNAMTIITTRGDVSPKVEARIVKSVAGGYYVNIITVVITNIDFTQAFEQTVEQKMIAEQEQLKAEYEKARAIIEAEKALEVEKLSAQAKIAAAEGSAKAQIEIASAEAESIRLKSIEVARLLGFNVTTEEINGKTVQVIDFTDKDKDEIEVISGYLKYLEYLSAWNGELPGVLVTDDAANIIISP